MIISITLSSAGVDTGPFSLYSDIDNFVAPFETGVTRQALLNGYTTMSAPDGATIIGVKSTGVCSTFVKIIELTTTTTTTLLVGVIPCDIGTSFSGGLAYPSTKIVNLGITLGDVTLSFSAAAVPDQFIVTFDSGVVINTGYRGSSNYDFGESLRTIFNDSLTGKVDPVGTTYPNIGLYPDDGYPRVSSSPGVTSFTKGSVTETATVDVYAPQAGTYWSYTLHCPA